MTATNLQPFTELYVEAESYRQMRDTAVNDLGYPSILEALEELPIMQARIAALTVREATLRVALERAIRVAGEAAQEWDAAPAGMKAGKLLLALAGACKRYRPDIDAIHAALSCDPTVNPIAERDGMDADSLHGIADHAHPDGLL